MTIGILTAELPGETHCTINSHWPGTRRTWSAKTSSILDLICYTFQIWNAQQFVLKTYTASQHYTHTINISSLKRGLLDNFLLSVNPAFHFDDESRLALKKRVKARAFRRPPLKLQMKMGLIPYEYHIILPSLLSRTRPIDKRRRALG